MPELSRAVVVTRPLAQARPLAERLAALGRQPVIFPLLEIQPLPDTTQLAATLQRLTDFALVMFVSPNAIDAALPHIPTLSPWPQEVAIAVVGEGSRRRLAEHGLTPDKARIFCPATGDRMDSEALMRQLDMAALRDRQVLIVRGESGRNLLSDSLRQAGAQVHLLPAYRRLPPPMTAERQQVLRQLAERTHDWIITSSEALRVLIQQGQALLGKGGLGLLLQQQRLLVSHPRIAEVAQELGFRQICLTDSGDDALLAALQAA